MTRNTIVRMTGVVVAFATMALISTHVNAGFGAKLNGAIVGKVYSQETTKPVEKAFVWLTDLNTSRTLAKVYTDKTGEFMFPNLPAGRYMVQAFHTEFGQGVVKCAVNDNQKTEVKIVLVRTKK